MHVYCSSVASNLWAMAAKVNARGRVHVYYSSVAEQFVGYGCQGQCQRQGARVL